MNKEREALNKNLKILSNQIKFGLTCDKEVYAKALDNVVYEVIQMKTKLERLDNIDLDELIIVDGNLIEYNLEKVQNLIDTLRGIK